MSTHSLAVLSGNKLGKNHFYWLLILSAFTVLFINIFLPTVAEEGVYTNGSLEMIYHQHFGHPTLMGSHYYRPPLFNWCIILLTKLIFGTKHILIAARSVNFLAVAATTAVIYNFVQRQYQRQDLALFSTVLYLSGDLIFKRGWLAYSDPLLSLCVFLAITSLWRALDEDRFTALITAVLAIAAGFMTKSYIAYAFYAISGLVFVILHPRRLMLFRPLSILLHSLLLLLPWYYAKDVTDNVGYSASLAAVPSIWNYAKHIIITYPLSLILHFMPASIVAILAVYKHKLQPSLIFWLALANLLPYWLIPLNSIRYILPVYPLIAVCLALIIDKAGESYKHKAHVLLVIFAVLQFAFATLLAPYEHRVLRGNARDVALDIVARAGDAPIHFTHTTAQSLRVASAVNLLIAPRAPVELASLDDCGYTVSEHPDSSSGFGEIVSNYKLGSKSLNLFYKACEDS